MNAHIRKAYGILEGMVADRALIENLSLIQGDDILDLVSLAHRVKERYAPPFHACAIMSVKTGSCSEDCRFCSQSAHHSCRIDEFPLVDTERILERAREAYAAGVTSFGIVTGGSGYLKKGEEFSRILDAIDEVRKAFPDKGVCACLGHLTEETAAALAARGIASYNLNLQTSPLRYAELVATTHTVNDRIATILLLKKHGIPICCGGIIGIGEAMADRVDLAFTLRDIGADIIPLNVLIPIPGTPLEARTPPTAAEVAVTFAIFRLVNPAATIKFAAGRETVMRDFQGLIMTMANGFITGGYLTTRGRSYEDDIALARELECF